MDSMDMTWPVLNVELSRCKDEQTLLRWLNDERERRQPSYRLIRIYGRLAAVRRERELKELLRRAS